MKQNIIRIIGIEIASCTIISENYDVEVSDYKIF